MIGKQNTLVDLIEYKIALEEERKLDPQAYEAKYKAMFDPERVSDKLAKELTQSVLDYFLKPMP